MNWGRMSLVRQARSKSNIAAKALTALVTVQKDLRAQPPAFPAWGCLMGYSEFDPTARERPPWNAGRKVGAKKALKPRQI